MHAPEADLCPKYYRSKELPAWFRIGQLRETSRGDLDGYVFSGSNRYAWNSTITALSQEDIGQLVSDVNFLDTNVSLWLIEPIADVELTRRVPSVRSLSRAVWPVKGRYALHLSDLHFGMHHAYRNELGSTMMPRIAKETMADALLDDLDAVGISPRDIALVFITGDLTWCADAHEFANAQAFIGSLTNAFGIHTAQVVVVPGNHDIEWRDQSGEVDPDAELNYLTFCRQLYGVAPHKTFLRIHQFALSNRTICVIGLNSCRLESRQNAGLGFVGKEQLGATLRFLGSAVADEPCLRIALMHHHVLPVNYVEGIDAETKRISITLDAEAVIRSLLSASVRIVFHGHQHQPYVSEIRRIIEGFVPRFGVHSSVEADTVARIDGTLAVIGGGSIGVERAHLNVVGRNCYNIIDLGNPSELKIRTRIQSPVGPGFGDYQMVSFAC